MKRILLTAALLALPYAGAAHADEYALAICPISRGTACSLSWMPSAERCEQSRERNQTELQQTFKRQGTRPTLEWVCLRRRPSWDVVR